MPKPYNTSWKIRHSLHLIVAFTVIVGCAAFFRRWACTRQKKWWVMAWVYAAVTAAVFLTVNSPVKALSDAVMGIYMCLYFGMFILACVTLPAYLRTVYERQEGGAAPADPSAAESRPPVEFTVSHNAPESAAAPSGAAALQRLHQLDEILKDQPVYTGLCEVESISAQILDYIVKNPDEQNAAHTFTSYYLPEFLKLMENYAELFRIPVRTDKIVRTMGEIEQSLPTAAASFRNLYNSLYSEKAADISNSIDVFEKMMSQDGLTENTDSGDSIHLKL